MSVRSMLEVAVDLINWIFFCGMMNKKLYHFERVEESWVRGIFSPMPPQ